MTAHRMPALFVGHGSPMGAIQESRATRALGALGQTLPRPRAILCSSAHFRSREVRVTSSLRPETIHDFGGFPDELYQIRYPAPGDPALARQAVALLAAAGFEVEEDPRRGLDHGAWSPLLRLYPEADIPVVEVSLLRSDPARHVALGAALAPLREDGVLILGTGNLVHNLADLRPDPESPAERWAAEFDAWVAGTLEARDNEVLADYRSRAPHAERAQPTDEHLLPLLVASGAAGRDARVTFPYVGFEHGTLSMRCARLD